MANILDRYETGCARWICGQTPKDERTQTLKDYSAGKFRFLVNVGCFTEGFDEPGVQVVSVARPTKSRSLYAQMIGRGTRPLPGMVDYLDLPEHRQEAISRSGKPHLEVLDFVGNSGRHKLVSAVDILGGKYSDEIVARAKQTMEQAGEARDAREALAEADKEQRAQNERERVAERERRRRLVAQVDYTKQTVSPFDILAIEPERERGWHRGRLPTEKQITFLEKQGIKTEDLSFTHASQLIQEIIDRRDQQRATFKQSKVLAKYGYNPDASFSEAREIIDALAANGWKRPPDPEIEPVFTEAY
jgi:type I site-specific restriction endonuclease